MQCSQNSELLSQTAFIFTPAEPLTLLVVNHRSINKPTKFGDTYILPFCDYKTAEENCRARKFKSIIYSGGYSAGSTWADIEQFTYFIRSRLIAGGEVIVLS